MKCAWWYDDEDGKITETCTAEATHDRNCTIGSGPVCAAHVCRCSLTLEERARRDEVKRAEKAATQKAREDAAARIAEAAEIVRALAECMRPFSPSVGGGWICNLCMVHVEEGERGTEQHALSCPWYRARRWVEASK